MSAGGRAAAGSAAVPAWHAPMQVHGPAPASSAGTDGPCAPAVGADRPCACAGTSLTEVGSAAKAGLQNFVAVQLSGTYETWNVHRWAWE